MITCDGIVVVSQFIGEYFSPLPLEAEGDGKGYKLELGLGLNHSTAKSVYVLSFCPHMQRTYPS